MINTRIADAIDEKAKNQLIVFSSQKENMVTMFIFVKATHASFLKVK